MVGRKGIDVISAYAFHIASKFSHLSHSQPDVSHVQYMVVGWAFPGKETSIPVFLEGGARD